MNKLFHKLLHRNEEQHDRTPNEAVVEKLYSDHVNRQWVKLLSTLGMNKHFVESQGIELVTDEGTRYKDYLSGYGVYNAGHHHPKIAAALIEELQGSRPTMLQSHVPELAAYLARELTTLAGGKLTKVFFTSSGSEGVESAIKFARAATKRDGIVYCNGGFHGLTYGALSLMSNPWWKEGFGSTLPNTTGVPFGDLSALEAELQSKRYAAFITEPIQGESGVLLPGMDYLKGAQALCKKFGTAFVLDEVQTGIFRTGRFLAAHHFGVEPDMVILAKAMSGGFVPVGALLTSDEYNRAVFSTLDRAFVHASTFGENSLAMRAGLATLNTIEEEGLGANGLAMGQLLREEINKLAPNYEMLKEARGLGCMNGIEFQPPKQLSLQLLFAGFSRCHPGLFGQMVVKHLFEESNILTQMCGNNYMVIKAYPPLVATETDVRAFVSAIEKLLDTIHNDRGKFWKQGLAIAMRALSPASST
ncbi:MAG: aspartate aminotransferase family protein [Bdellovibrionota bacterium]